MQVETGGQWRVGLSRYKPRGPVVGIAVTFVVHRYNVHENRVLGGGF